MVLDRPWMHFREPESPHSLSDVYMDFPRVQRSFRNIALFLAFVLVPFFVRLGTSAVYIFNASHIVQESSAFSTCVQDERCGLASSLASNGRFRWIYLAFTILSLLTSLAMKAVALSVFRNDRVDGISPSYMYSLDRFILLSELRGSICSPPFFAGELLRQLRWKTFPVLASFPLQLFNWIVVKTWMGQASEPTDHWTFIFSLAFYFIFDLVPFLLAVMAYTPTRGAFTHTKLRRYLCYHLEQNVKAAQGLHEVVQSSKDSVEKA
ncbi:hypothetical protein BDY24DRAFT_440403 [Mrakia frigida]|uniref:uncharacterized protein n=1 Tax=Mrakia frigida TaxID=29902 RepID=UPI003FCC1664